jgi:hypothetical protein
LEKQNHLEAGGRNGDGTQVASKKRKLDALQDAAGRGGGGSWAAIKDISFSIPQRKKLLLEIGLLPEQGLRGRNVASDEIEFAVRWKDIREFYKFFMLDLIDECKWLTFEGGIEHIACLPAPEKAQAQYNFCISPLNGGDGINPVSGDGVSAAQQILWTVPNMVLKSTQISGEIAVESEETYRSLLLRVLNGCLGHFGKQVVVPNEKAFASQTTQAYRKGEKAVHVKAFRGNKDGKCIFPCNGIIYYPSYADMTQWRCVPVERTTNDRGVGARLQYANLVQQAGFLFFLPTGIFWGFKKPLIFFAFDSIDSVSYTSVLQRTFNLSIATRNCLDDTIEFEFSMVDQADFGGIDAYVKRHGLQDASMAEQRRAKKLNINGVKNEHGEDEHDNGEGDLDKARKELEDAEDAEEDDDENFDPGSEGESEGSGSSSEEEEEDEGHGEDRGPDGDLVQEELGSEVEELEESD